MQHNCAHEDMRKTNPRSAHFSLICLSLPSATVKRRERLYRKEHNALPLARRPITFSCSFASLNAPPPCSLLPSFMPCRRPQVPASVRHAHSGYPGVRAGVADPSLDTLLILRRSDIERGRWRRHPLIRACRPDCISSFLPLNMCHQDRTFGSILLDSY